MENHEIERLFKESMEALDLILGSDLYTQKDTMLQVKEKLKHWQSEFKLKSTLTTISVEELEFMNLEINEIFDEYLSKESAKDNYTERLSYYFSILLHYWKDEMLEEKR